MKFEETAEYQRGREAENVVVEFLRSRGVAVLPAYGMLDVDPSTKAPVLLLPKGERLVIPDLLAFCPTERMYWVEVKSKSVPGYFRIYQTQTHAIDYALYKEYLKIERITGIKVWIVIHELVSGEILTISLADIDRNGKRNPNWPNKNGLGSRCQQGGMWWRRDEMIILGVVKPDTLPVSGKPYAVDNGQVESVGGT